MRTLLVSTSALTLTGCSEFLNGAANLAEKSHGVTWPGAFLVVGVCASLAYVTGKFFS